MILDEQTAGHCGSCHESVGAWRGRLLRTSIGIWFHPACFVRSRATSPQLPTSRRVVTYHIRYSAVLLDYAAVEDGAAVAGAALT